MSSIRHRGEIDASIRARKADSSAGSQADPSLEWTADWGTALAGDRATAAKGVQASRPAPRTRRSGIPGWLRAILFLPATPAPMAHRDAHLSDLGRQMAHPPPKPQGAVTAAVSAFVPAALLHHDGGSGKSTGHATSLSGITAGPRRRFLAGEQRRREAVSVLLLLFVASVFSIAGPISGLGSSPDPTPIYVMVDGPGGNPTAPDNEVPGIVPPGTNALDHTFLPPPPTKAPVKRPASTPIRVRTFVALGDSLTAWPSYNPWPSRLDASDAVLRLVHNAGVPGNTTAQMRARLTADVYPYKPDILFVLGGTNDLGYGVSQSAIIANLRAIVVGAKAHRMMVVLVFVPPDSYTDMGAKIRSLNQAIWNLAVSQGVHAADIYTPLANSNGVFYPKYTVDGLHFSDTGCQVVANTIWNRMKRLGL